MPFSNPVSPPARRLAYAALFVAAACDSAVTPEYLGEPIIRFRGQVTGEASERSTPDPEVAVLWLTCPENDTVCQFYGGGGGGGITIPEGTDPNDPELHACMETCGLEPACAPWTASGGYLGLMYCDEFIQCIDDCGGRVVWQIQFSSRFFGGGISQPTSIEGDFPAAFTLNIYEAPVEHARRWTSLGILSRTPEEQRLAMGFVIAKGPGEVSISPDEGIIGPILGAAQSHVVIYNEVEISPYNETGAILELEEPLPPGFHIFDHRYEPCPPFPWGGHLGSFHCGSRFSLSPMDIESEINVTLGNASEIHWPLLEHRGQPPGLPN